MPEVGSYEAKTHFSRLLARVAKGERITITRHGVPVAALVPAEGRSAPRRAADAIEALRTFRKGLRLKMPLRKAIDEGRR